MKNITKYIRVGFSLILFLGGCMEEYEIFIDPKADFVLEKTTFDVMEAVYVQNTGTGETFTFWPGDEGQNYSLVSSSRNEGLPPNRGNDFEYSYLRSGTYTMTIIASSYNEETGKYVQNINSVEITINPGNNGNNFTTFAIDNALAGYSPEGTIEDTKITIPIGFINRASGISDTDYAALINKRPPLFSVNSSSAKVYSEEGTLLIGRGDDDYDLNIINATTLEPIIRKFTVIQDNVEKEYSVGALFYPEISNLKVMGFTAIQYSEDGLSSADEDEIKELQLAYPDRTFFGVFLIGANENSLKTATLDFDLDDGVTLQLKETGEEIIKNSTQVDFSTPPVEFEIVKTVQGFTVKSEFSVYTTVF